jgi:NADH dehydrogenase
MAYRLNLLTHRTDPDFISPSGQISIVRGSIEDERSLIDCFEGTDVVYHLIGIIAETRTKTFEKTVADGTARVVSAAQKAGVRKIVYLSALGTAQDSDSKYFRTKWEAEQHVIKSGIDYTIFRPSIVYGPGDKFINKIAGMIRKLPVVPVIGDGLYKLQPVFVDELAAIMTMAAEKEMSSGKIYDIGGPQQLTYLEILDIIKRIFDVRKPAIHIPLSLAKMTAWMLEKIMKPAPLTRDQLKMMAAGSTCDQTVAEKEFGARFSPMETQLLKYMRK